MKLLLLLLLLLVNNILCINYSEFILKAGTKTKGYCNKNDYIFSFENSSFLNNKFPKQGNEFNLLMENGNISKCKIKKKDIFLNKFDILCEIKNYFGCLKNIISESPKLGSEEPEKIFFENGDILRFEGFSNIENKINIINEGGFIKKELDEEKNFIFYITNNKINKLIYKNKEFKIYVKINNEKKIALCEIPKIDSTNNFDIKCIINENISTYDKIETIDNPQDDEIIFSGFNNIKEEEKEPIALEPGSIKIGEDGFIIFNNKITKKITPDKIEGQFIKFSVQLNNQNDIDIKCFFDINSFVDQKVNLNCTIEEMEIKSIYISDIKSTFIIYGETLNCEKFIGLTLYTLTLGTLIKGNYNEDTKIYSYKFINTEISKKISANKWFYLFITINNEEKVSVCKIVG